MAETEWSFKTSFCPKCIQVIMQLNLQMFFALMFRNFLLPYFHSAQMPALNKQLLPYEIMALKPDFVIDTSMSYMRNLTFDSLTKTQFNTT